TKRIKTQGVVKIPPSYTWYICSDKETNQIAYNLTVIADQDDLILTPNFGELAPGWPLKFNQNLINI
ncbi:3359_t:CDS:2, partial [Entrophospora sp. SA101]